MLPRHGFAESMETGSLDDHQGATLSMFDTWSPQEQIEFSKRVLSRMSHSQQGQISNYLLQILQRDFISGLPGTLCCVKICFCCTCTAYSVPTCIVYSNENSFLSAKPNVVFVYFHDCMSALSCIITYCSISLSKFTTVCLTNTTTITTP